MGVTNPFSGIIRAFKKVRRIPIVLVAISFMYSVYLMYVCFIMPIFMKILPIYLAVYTKVEALKKRYNLDAEFRHWQSNKVELLSLGEKGYRLKTEELGLDQEQLELLKEMHQRAHEIVIAEIDRDGFMLSYFGPIKNTPTVSKHQFLARKRFNLQVVAINGYVGVKKNYHDNKLCFVREINALHNLGLAGCNVPAIMDVDFDHLTLTFSYILGPVLREELAKRGAVLRDRDVDNNPTFTSLEPEDRWLKRIQEGKHVLYDVIDQQFVENLFTQLKKIHACGFILDDIKYGNIIIEKRSGNPYLIDFDFSRDYPNLGKDTFRILRDHDIDKFNLHFNTEKLTHNRIKKRIKQKSISSTSNWHGSVYFGAGLRMGSIWDVNSHYDRWHYILKHNFPSLSGKRILDLGAKIGFNSIQMLRHGAREVIGIESDIKVITDGNFIKAAFEWADNTQYNFRYTQANVMETPTLNLGKFDIAIALCSLYHLNDHSISNLIQYISTVASNFILQWKIDINIKRKHSYNYDKTSVKYAVNILRSNGFPVIQVIAPPRYSYPLVIGRKEN